MTIRNPKTDGNEHLIVAEEDMPEDQTATRHIELDGRSFTVNSTDPYGLWHITPATGKVPTALQGVYTSPLEAENAIKAYIALKNHVKAPLASNTSISS